MKAARLCAGLFALWVMDTRAIAANVKLAAAGNPAVIAGSTVANTDPSTIHEDLGVWPGTAITDFPPAIVTGDMRHAGGAGAMKAHSDLITPHNLAAAATNLTRQDLGDLPPMPEISEPAGWALALAGFGLVGLGLRWRSKDQSRRSSRTIGTVP